LANGIRLSLIDDSNRGDHFHLRSGDGCYYLFEYTSHRDYSFSTTNNLISNLKKKPSQSGLPGYHYKARAIRECAQHLRGALNPDWVRDATFVPTPGSKARVHPDFDDRIVQICQLLCQPPPDVRGLVIQIDSTAASHEVAPGERVTVEELLAVYQIDETLAVPPPRKIAIVDDVLTAGTHFRAMHTVLARRFPEVPIVGIFVARRVFPDEESESEGS
jgi:hypothetical protein